MWIPGLKGLIDHRLKFVLSVKWFSSKVKFRFVEFFAMVQSQL